MKRFRIQLVIALVVLICGISLMGVVYLVFNKPEVYINPGVIVTQPSPVSSPRSAFPAFMKFAIAWLFSVSGASSQRIFSCHGMTVSVTSF